MSPHRLRLLISFTALAIASLVEAYSVGRSTNLTKTELREETLEIKSELPVSGSHITVTTTPIITTLISNVNISKNDDYSTSTIINTNVVENGTEITITDLLAINNTIGLAKNQNETTDSYITALNNTAIFENTSEIQVSDNITRSEGYDNSSSTVEESNDLTTLKVGNVSSLNAEEIIATDQNETDSSGFLDNDTESSASEQFVSTLPSWKKYVTIIRKRIINDSTPLATTDVSEILTVAPTKKVRVTLEDAYAYTSKIPSLEDLRNQFLSLKNKLSSENRDETTISALRTEADVSLPMASENETKWTQTEVYSLKLGGFFNLSSQSTISPPTTNYTETSDARTNESEIYGNMFELYTDTEGLENKNASGAKSRSHLVDDALKEELLEEEVIKNNKENSDKRSTSLSSPISGQDENLTVQPITQDINKNFSMYTVSPNYKTMKKLEMQPVKQFLRDPDDNSWRNESLSSLGIIFNANNSSKTFTQVLKEKTEAEMKNLIEGEKESKNKENKKEFRRRLEQMTEKRKSKKKFDDNISLLTEFEQKNASDDTTITPKLESPADTVPVPISITTTGGTTILPNTTTLLTTVTLPTTVITTTSPSTSTFTRLSEQSTFPTATVKASYITDGSYLTTKKLFLSHYYDGDEESNVDYVTAIDLKRFTVPYYTTNTPTLSVPITQTLRQYFLDRKPTIQYFPPKTSKKININDYDLDFQRKVNAYTTKPSLLSSNFQIPQITTKESFEITTKENLLPKPNTYRMSDFLYNPGDLNRELHFSPTQGINPNDGYTIENQADTLEKNSYFLKPFVNYFSDVAKDHDDERDTQFIPTFTQPPLRGVTINELATTKGKAKPDVHDYDYETQFRKDILERFVDNFNQHNERYKVDFPIVYNSSVVHKKTQENGKVVASSSAFMRRLYELPANKYDVNNYSPCESNCDNVTVELSPAYELHYYVPEQEEKEVLDPRSTMPYNYRL